MRLFIAINFSPRFKTALHELTKDLAAQAVFCRATAPENHHLTLAFIGESERAQDIIELMQPDLGEAFTLVTADLGRFKREGGDIYWLGIRRNPQLERLQAELCQRLRHAGFQLERKAFRPHLTLLRQASFPAEFDLSAVSRKLSPLHERCFKVSLMESRREQGRLVYRELYAKELSN